MIIVIVIVAVALNVTHFSWLLCRAVGTSAIRNAHTDIARNKSEVNR